MSQAKVDRYKEEKKNRKKTMAKEKRLHLLAVVCGWLVVIALAGWAGVSGYRIYESKKPVETIYANVDAITDYMNSLSTEELRKITRGVFSATGYFSAILPFFLCTLFYSPVSAPESSAFASAFSIAFNNTTDVYW